MIFNPNDMAAAGGVGGAVVGTYTGDGTYYRKITFDFEPAIVYILQASYSGTPGIYVTMVFQGFFFAEILYNNTVSRLNCSLQGNTIETSGLSSDLDALNRKGTTYTYVAIPKA